MGERTLLTSRPSAATKVGSRLRPPKRGYVALAKAGRQEAVGSEEHRPRPAMLFLLRKARDLPLVSSARGCKPPTGRRQLLRVPPACVGTPRPLPQAGWAGTARLPPPTQAGSVSPPSGGRGGTYTDLLSRSLLGKAKAAHRRLPAAPAGPPAVRSPPQNAGRRPRRRPGRLTLRGHAARIPSKRTTDLGRTSGFGRSPPRKGEPPAWRQDDRPGQDQRLRAQPAAEGRAARLAAPALLFTWLKCYLITS